MSVKKFGYKPPPYGDSPVMPNTVTGKHKDEDALVARCHEEISNCVYNIRKTKKEINEKMLTCEGWLKKLYAAHQKLLALNEEFDRMMKEDEFLMKFDVDRYTENNKTKE